MEIIDTSPPLRFIEGFPAYPIYSFDYRWSQDGIQDPERPSWYEGLPEGRIWNDSNFTKMYQHDQTDAELLAHAAEVWKGFAASGKFQNPNQLNMQVKFREYETWKLTWFQHETFDIGQTNEQALESFEQFVSRKEKLIKQAQTVIDKAVCCLMGAEDRWRWHGSEPDGNAENHSPAPCRCTHCKEQGLIRIAH